MSGAVAGDAGQVRLELEAQLGELGLAEEIAALRSAGAVA